jgi:pyruvate/2-oxoglutarate dehydrogenase complex dihydrolipoamide acyltransferase (E2) component
MTDAVSPTPLASANQQDVGAPLHGTVIAIEVVAGQAVAAGQVLALIESMKMEVPVEAPCSGTVRAVRAALGDVVGDGDVLLTLARGAAPRADLAALQQRRAMLADSARPEAMARRHAGGLRSARENVADLLDAGSFSEYGAFAVAAQRSRRSLDDLQRPHPGRRPDHGTGTVATTGRWP